MVALRVLFARPDLGRSSAIELKFLTRQWTGEVDRERYELKGHGAQDNCSYNVVKDICRSRRADRPPARFTSGSGVSTYASLNDPPPGAGVPRPEPNTARL
jgi:hypothetical protein